MRNIRIPSLMVVNLSCVAQTGLESMLPIATPSANCYVGLRGGRGPVRRAVGNRIGKCFTAMPLMASWGRRRLLRSTKCRNGAKNIVCHPFSFQAEDGERNWAVTGVQTCAHTI